ncbi:MAG TPA: lysylphosphatidylglycerol synthase transmembrane domain-containing protein [Candidatus Sulfotelmatobacter sp.]|jgi:glycosyltransferase 2 family protein|nr:lysylphosphatidylglycerol synthase transmembrane domain-containing protein [Candidatus Sulfotelmatobacter sp.]
MNESHAGTESTSTEQAAAAHPYRAFAVRAGLGLLVVALLLWRFDARPIFRVISRERPAYFAAAVALYLAGQALCAYRWQILAALIKLHGRYSEFFRYLFVGMFTNLFVPGLLGGDAARSVYLGRRYDRLGEAIASVVADRAVGLLGLFWIAAIAAKFLNFAPIPSSVTTPTIAVGVIALAGFLAAPLVARLIHLMPRPLRRAGGIVAPYLHHPAALIPAIALSIVLQILLATCQYILAAGLGMSVPLSLFILCVPIANVFASLPLTLNGLGIRESAYLVLFGMAGMRKEDAIALGLLWFAATMLGGLTGAVAFITTPAAGKAKE